jgi:hypothetical protein
MQNKKINILNIKQMKEINQTDRQCDFIWPTVYMWNHIHITTKLSTSARNLLDVFVLHMRPEDNLVYFGDEDMNYYLQYCEKKLQIMYSEKTTRNAISELNKADLLLRGRNNVYFINPLYTFKWSITLDHKKLIKTVQENTGRTLLTDNLKEVIIQPRKNETASMPDGI